jgi:hypothetical protein
MGIWRALTVLGLLAMTTAPAFAKQDDDDKQEKKLEKTKGAPEIDGTSLGGAVAVLVGGTFLFGARGKRRRQNDAA